MANLRQFQGRFVVEPSEWQFFRKAVRQFGYNTASEALREKVREINAMEQRRIMIEKPKAGEQK